MVWFGKSRREVCFTVVFFVSIHWFYRLMFRYELPLDEDLVKEWIAGEVVFFPWGGLVLIDSISGDLGLLGGGLGLVGNKWTGVEGWKFQVDWGWIWIWVFGPGCGFG